MSHKTLSPTVQIDQERIFALAVRAAELFGWGLVINLDDPDRPVITVGTPAGRATWPLPVKEVLGLCRINNKRWQDFTPSQKRRMIEQYLKSL
ncbi:MAG: hypothetical protein ACR2GW_07135 [Pyrinomonadaceae bacterium]